MYHVYAVRMNGETKTHTFIRAFESIENAKNMLDRSKCGDADYFYIEDSRTAAREFYLPYPIPKNKLILVQKDWEASVAIHDGKNPLGPV